MYEEFHNSGRRIALSILAACGALLVLAGCKDNNSASTPNGGTQTAGGGNEIIIGEYGSLTGAQADFGKQTDQGIQLAVEEINKTGGVERDGKKMPIRLISDDDKSQAQLAETS